MLVENGHPPLKNTTPAESNIVLLYRKDHKGFSQRPQRLFISRRRAGTSHGKQAGKQRCKTVVSNENQLNTQNILPAKIGDIGNDHKIIPRAGNNPRRAYH